MIDKPVCYGTIALGTGSPCHNCGINALCAAYRTRTEKFGILLYPRALSSEDKKKQASADMKGMSTIDEEKLSLLNTAFLSLGFHYRRGSYYFGKKRVMKVTEANSARVALTFYSLPLGLVTNAPSKDRALKIIPLIKTVPIKGVNTPNEIASLRDKARGCLAYFTEPMDAVTLVGELMSTLREQL